MKSLQASLVLYKLAILCLGVTATKTKIELTSKDITTTTLEPKFFTEYNSQRVKISYGSQVVPSMHEDNGMAKLKAKVPLPCNDCLITWMQAGLEYEDGTIADPNNGMWLHHTVFSVLEKKNLVCPKKKWGDRFFASGNERTPIDLCLNGKSKTGYYIGPNDTMGAATELMNMSHEPSRVVLTMTWEYIPTLPNGFETITPYWLDIGGCGSSSKPAYENSVFEYKSPVRKAPRYGRVITVASHLHDGATQLSLIKNGKAVCAAKPTYKTYQEGSHHGMVETEHISSIEVCHDVAMTSPGDKWSITASYDTNKYQPMKMESDDLEPIMGIAMVYVAETGDTPPRHYRKHHHHKLVLKLSIVILALTCGLVYAWMWKKGISLMDIIPFRKRSIRLGEAPNDNKSTLPLLRPEYQDDE